MNLNIALIPVTSFPTYAQILINKYLIAIILDVVKRSSRGL